MMRLVPEMSCQKCGNKALLTFQPITKDLEEGMKVIIDAVPVYQCSACHHTQMELMARATMEEMIQKIIDSELHMGESARISIKWTKLEEASPIRSLLPVQKNVEQQPRYYEAAFA